MACWRLSWARWAVLVVDHRDARADETGNREHRHAGPKGEGDVGVAQVVEIAQRLDAGRILGGLPMAAAEAAEVDAAASSVRKEDRAL